MFVRVQNVKRNAKTYRYVRLVRSERRKSDGMPVQVTIANLGSLSDEEIANLKTALQASREGKRVRIEDIVAFKLPEHVVRDNFDWLDIAVLLRLWRQWGLDELLNSLMPIEEADVRPADVVCALVIHRLVNPSSKLNASKWFAQTALPELLGISSTAFNNTRLHRILERLSTVQSELEAGLASRYLRKKKAFATIFVDTTDTWFCGRGPRLAQKGKTKEGMYRRKLGILLVCNEDGFPLNWKVLPGNQNDGLALSTAMSELAERSWTDQVPIVGDRAVGRPSYIKSFLQQNVRFLVAVAVSDIEYFAKDIPMALFENLKTGWDGEDFEPYLSTAGQQALDAGFEFVTDDLYVLDLGVVTLDETLAKATKAPRDSKEIQKAPSLAAKAVQQAWKIKQERDRDITLSWEKVGRLYKMSATRALMRVQLLHLPQDILERVVSGEARISIRALERLTKLDSEEEQRSQFEDIISDPSRPVPERVPARPEQKPKNIGSPVRVVVCFNPKLFVGKRRQFKGQCQEVYDFVKQLNERLDNPSYKRTKEQVYGAVDRKLRKFSFVDLFKIKIDVDENSKPRHVTLERDETSWQRRRKYDGITLLVAHPELLQSAAELSRCYRAKDTVEKDFRIIKSVVELRPVFHRTDAKVQAHVSICMLSLLLERTLRRRLQNTPLDGRDPNSLLKQTSSCHLNRLSLDSASEPFYSITQCNPDQKEILKHLEMSDLANDAILDELIMR